MILLIHRIGPNDPPLKVSMKFEAMNFVSHTSLFHAHSVLFNVNHKQILVMSENHCN